MKLPGHIDELLGRLLAAGFEVLEDEFRHDEPAAPRVIVLASPDAVVRLSEVDGGWEVEGLPDDLR